MLALCSLLETAGPVVSLLGTSSLIPRTHTLTGSSKHHLIGLCCPILQEKPVVSNLLTFASLQYQKRDYAQPQLVVAGPLNPEIFFCSCIPHSMWSRLQEDESRFLVPLGSCQAVQS